MKKQIRHIPLLILLTLLFVSCNDASNGLADEIIEKEDSAIVYVDTFFTDLLMLDEGGVTGADGTISFSLNDGSSIFMMGDSFFGQVDASGKRSNATMTRNSFIRINQSYNYISSYYQGSYSNPTSLFEPKESNTASEPYWYWPGHGFQHGDVLFLFMTKFYQKSAGAWGFAFKGTDCIRVKASNFKQIISQEELFSEASTVHWGHSVIKEGDTVYIYGSNFNNATFTSTLHLARTSIGENNQLQTFEYYTKNGWSNQENASVPLEGISTPISEQFSVFKLENKYVLVTQERSWGSGKIFSYIADTPYGEWKNKKLLYTTPEATTNEELFTYNAMAHPQFINDKNELLIAYNVNSHDFQSLFEHAEYYRPVFIRVPLSIILEN